MPADKVYEQYTAWAKQYDEEMYNLVTSNEAMAREIFNIDKEKGKAIERGEKLEISYWDLKEVNNSYENYYIRKCPKCNRELENDFEYCPYCGEKLK